MKILIVNDDGARGEGLHALIRALKDEHDVTVVVPEIEQSGKSHSMTFFDPLYFNKIHLAEADYDVYTVKGTPGDCVLMALDQIVEARPDLLLSGINKGFNTAGAIIYSGTVSAAFEGANRGIPSIALSAGFIDVDFDEVARVFRMMLPAFTAEKEVFFYNVNFPTVPLKEIRGIRKTTIDPLVVTECMEKRIDPFYRAYYWHSYNGHNNKEFHYAEGSDLDALDKKFISVTPLKLNYFDEKKFQSMDDFSAVFDAVKAMK